MTIGLVLALDADGAGLGATVASLVRQDVADWHLVAARPAVGGPAGAVTTDPPGPVPSDLPPDDPRVTVLDVPAPRGEQPDDDGVWFLLEAARSVVRGAYVGVLGAGDELEPGALAAVLLVAGTQPRVDVVYTDEQWAAPGSEGIATKPDYLPHYLESYPYLGRLCLVDADLLDRVGGFRPGVGGVEEWDAHLRVTERASRVAHVPVTAVTRAAPPRQDAAAHAAGVRAVQGHVERSGRPGAAEAAEVPLGVRLWWGVPDPPLVSVVVPTAGSRRTVHGEPSLLVERCLRSLRDLTTYPSWEVVVVTSAHTPPDVVPVLRDLLGDRLVVQPVDGAFSFSRSVNEGARAARGDLLLLLNDDTEVLEPRWLDRMVAAAQDPDVGAVGAKLLFEDGTIQHLGVIAADDGPPVHALGSETDGTGRFGAKVLDMDYLAVTGACLLTPAALFGDVGGFCEDLPLNYNDVDYCLKVAASGRSVVSTPFARLHHYESSSRGHVQEAWETRLLERRWGLRMRTDPHVHYRTRL